MNKVIFLIIIISLLIISTTSYSQTYTFPNCPWAGTEIIWVAKDKGFFDKEQFDIDITQYSTVPDWVKAISSERFDFQHSWIGNGFEFWFKEKPSKRILIGATSHDQGFAAFVAKKGIRGKDLKGKTIGVEFDSGAYKYILYKYLKKYGLSLNDVRIVVLASDELIANFMRGRLKVIIATGRSIHEVVNKGNGVILTSTKEYYEVVINGIWIPSERFKKIPRDDLKKWWWAIFKAEAWMLDSKNVRELMEIVSKRYHMVPEMVHAYSSLENLKSYRENSIKDYTSKNTKYYTSKIPMVFDEIKEIRRQSGLSTEYNYEDIVDMSAMMEVLQEMNY